MPEVRDLGTRAVKLKTVEVAVPFRLSGWQFPQRPPTGHQSSDYSMSMWYKSVPLTSLHSVDRTFEYVDYNGHKLKYRTFSIRLPPMPLGT